MVDVFKTNILDAEIANKVAIELSWHLPESVINFDLEDCDHILRVEGKESSIEKVNSLFQRLGYVCETLED